MSSVTSTGSSNGTTIISGPDVIQKTDFYVKAGILHPIVVGSIAVIALFSYLRLGSNRSVAPITVFDWVINVALGSTLAGIVNGNSLVRGLLALATMLGFQYITSTLASRFNQRLAWVFQGPPLVVAFRGTMLTNIMKKHRISPSDVNAALRQHGVLNICQVECGIIEPNGKFSIFTTKQLEDAGVDADVLTTVPAYKALCEEESRTGRSRSTGFGNSDEERGEMRRGKDQASPNMDSAANEVS
ncbi:hypothetical protein BP6252_13069 [Coleophoma cylindrospora]|uniref:YetF C-terminal domain-containing protein n=1 Tax=Coleophoma cylindrospora TaxID=1849047 RepID=A0A3D8Q9S7_9HELO|nr:hypothetical protein BP6252_13069 [Coleophoma cylindrospora]